MSETEQTLFSVEVIGFPSIDRTVLASAFSLSQRRSIRYVQYQSSKRRPDLFLVDADDVRAVTLLATRQPSATHPAILMGQDAHGMSWPLLARPVRWLQLLDTLDRTVQQAIEAREPYPSTAYDSWPFVDRRARVRLDLDLGGGNKTNEHQRTQAQPQSAPTLAAIAEPPPLRVMLVDHHGPTRELLTGWLADQACHAEVAASSDEVLALLQRHCYACVIINFAEAQIDCFALSRAIKASKAQPMPAVIGINPQRSLLSRMQALMSGCDAYLADPLTTESLGAALEKYLPETKSVSAVR